MLKHHTIASDTLGSDSLSSMPVDPILQDQNTEFVSSSGSNQDSVTQSDRSFSEPIENEIFTDLEVIDAPMSDTLFDLSASNVGVAGATPQYTVGTSYSDPIDYGDPLTDSVHWRLQAGNASCSVVAQISVYESLTGYRVSETEACNYAQSQGWFNPQSGTPQVYGGKVLNALGIRTYGGSNVTLNNLAYALQKGDKPIVSVDANEIWNPIHDSNGNPVEQADAGHAVWVTGIDIKPNGSINIILNDSGTRYGKSETVNFLDFYYAWQDRSFYATIADNPMT
jgi:hypothetical protein